MTSPYDTYVSPLASRNASPAMLRLWSPRHKFNTWRRIWLAVAEAQHEVGRSALRADSRPEGPSPHGRLGEPTHQSGRLGEPTHQSGRLGEPTYQELVTEEQLEELRGVVSRGITDDEIRLAEKYERELRHDVMAHVHALGDSCPKAKGIIHLGMTSQDVNDNAEIILLEQAGNLIVTKVAMLQCVLGGRAAEYKAIPTLAFTHYQAAQPTTVGRRMAGWTYELQEASWPLVRVWDGIKGRGLRGATGTQASYLALFDGDSAMVDKMERAFCDRLAAQFFRDRERIDGFYLLHDLVTQTYPRVVDATFLSGLANIASVLHKIATDIRLLSNRKEIDEPFEDKQIGSSAMPYKRNPMRCERICGLARFVMNLVGNAYDTAATQWLERTLDDSSNRRLSLPEAFLALDGALDLMHNVASGLIVHEAMVKKNLMAELPFMATENILMACVKLGGDRQHYHEVIRRHAQAAGLRVKQEGLDNDLLERLRADREFWSTARGGPLAGELDWDNLLDPMKYVGRSVEQTERFIKEVVEPLREQYAEAISKLEESGPKV